MTTLPKVPISTYRLQFNRDFTFRRAAELVPYLAALGISHCYASPYLRARPGSMHGYDIIDHNTLNPEIGSTDDYEYFVGELHRHGMGQILDIVPNHMGVMGADSAWWLDVLENGEASVYAEFFDIAWDPVKTELQGKVLIPILDAQYGDALESGAIRLSFDAERGEFSVFCYQQHRFPLDPKEYTRILTLGLEAFEQRLGATHEDLLELESVTTAFSHLAERGNLSPEKKAERAREKEVQKRRLAALVARSTDIREFLTQNVQKLNGTKGDPQSFEGLHELIKAQPFRLAQWRAAADDINYRRFFDVNDLAGLRQENDLVFSATHRFVFELIAAGKVDGLRIDHPDGLYDPAQYFRALRSGVAASGSDHRATPTYVVAEKILTGDERLRKDWPIQGMTGYEFGSLVNGLFVDPAAESKMERTYRAFIGEAMDFGDLVYRCKKLILIVSLASELNVLANALSRIALSNRHTCDFTLNSLRMALADIAASFPVYRTYLNGSQVSDADRQSIERAIARARNRSHAADLTIFDFMQRMLLVEMSGQETPEYQRAVLRFAMKFQQFSGAVAAKGMEDTAFYRYNRLVSLNEVGDDPRHFGITVEEFHRANRRRGQCWPASMLSTSTHDSKRSEDVRLRINVLSEIPALWRLSLRHWRKWNRNRRRLVDGAPAPSRNHESLLYQTLVGTWPLESLDEAGWQKFSERIEQYMIKAMREAKDSTSWANPNLAYEAATTRFIRSLVLHRKKNRFAAEFPDFHRRISRIAMFHGLSETLLKLTSPGVPDIYQGNEIWSFDLVDPDNRRPVDYERRQNLLGKLPGDDQETRDGAGESRELLDHLEDGAAKLFLIRKTLGVRKQHGALFGSGDYVPLEVQGSQSSHICSFARRKNGEVAIIAVPRLCAALLGEHASNPIGGEVWGDTELRLPDPLRGMKYRNVLTGELLRSGGGGQGIDISALLANFPVALAIAESFTA
jgi:(1->4)-alpha-D-glucan 1-alpha-D-glucosylmutase